MYNHNHLETTYRAWHIADKRWLDSEELVGNARVTSLGDKHPTMSFSYEGCKIEKCIGERDIRGRKIFQGDIVRRKGVVSGEEIGVVEIGRGDCSITGEQELGVWFATQRREPFWSRSYEYEVIGNVHENAYLLKKAKKE
jgi:uncharacterized phage protein (TIGR01671 family)